MATTNYLDKRKISGIEKRARGLVQSDNLWGHILTGAIVTAFCISTVHLMGDLRGWGFLGWTLGILSSIATEGAFLFHRYRSYIQHENATQKWAALGGMIIALIGSLFYFGADMLLLLDMLNRAIAGPIAIGIMVVVLLSAVISESIYELASHTSAYERQKRGDALEVLKISDDTRLELDRGDLEIMKAQADLVLAATFQKAESIREAIPDTISRLTGQAEVLDPDQVKDQFTELRASDLFANLPANGNGHKAPKVSAG